jgi:hypothetical protein
MRQSASALIQLARMACEAVAEGAFTPIVFERCERIGGGVAVLLGYPSTTAEGRSCIVWT